MTQFLGFTAEQTSKVTGLTMRQLSYWSRTGFFNPEADSGNRAYGKVYSFRDLVVLRAIGILRNTYRVPLQELRKVGQWLGREHSSPWSSLRLFIAGRQVYFEKPASGAIVAAGPSRQSVMPLELVTVAKDTEAEVTRLQSRGPQDIGE